MSPDLFSCDGCGSSAFGIETGSLIGDERPYITEIRCRECGETWDAVPSPAKLDRRD